MCTSRKKRLEEVKTEFAAKVVRGIAAQPEDGKIFSNFSVLTSVFAKSAQDYIVAGEIVDPVALESALMDPVAIGAYYAGLFNFLPLEYMVQGAIETVNVYRFQKEELFFNPFLEERSRITVQLKVLEGEFSPEDPITVSFVQDSEDEGETVEITADLVDGVPPNFFINPSQFNFIKTSKPCVLEFTLAD